MNREFIDSIEFARKNNNSNPGLMIRNSILPVHMLLCAMLTVIIPIMRANFEADSFTILLNTFVSTTLLTWLLYQWRIVKKSLLNPYGIFLGATFLYHFGQFIVHCFGVKTGKFGAAFNLFRFNDSTLLDVQYISILAMVYLQLGALIAARKTGFITSESTLKHISRAIDAQVVGILFIAVSFIPELLDIKQLWEIRSTHGYGSVWTQAQETGLGNWMSVLAGYFFPGLLLLTAGWNGSWPKLIFGMICICFLVIIYLIVGLRSEAFQPLLAFLWVFHTCVRPLPKPLFKSGAMLVLFVIMPLVPILRTQSLAKGLSIESVTEQYRSIDNPILSFLDECGNSTVTFADTLELVPRSRSFALGGDYANSLIGPFNFVLPVDFTDGNADPGKWVVVKRYPERVHGGMWLGYSYIGESYLEFGWVGIPFVMFAFGYWICRITDISMSCGDAAGVAVVGVVLRYLPHLARGDTFMITRPYFRYVVIPLVLVWLVSKIRQPSTTTALRRNLRILTGKRGIHLNGNHEARMP